MALDPKNTNALNMSGFGNKLKEAREKKNLTIGQVQKQTHIHSAILKALEDGNCDNFLNPTYVKSFLKKYSDHLGLDSSQILKDYRKQYPELEPGKINKLPEPEASSRVVSGVVSSIKFIVVGVLAIALIVFVGGRVISHFKAQKPSKRALAVKAKHTAAKPKVSKKVSSESAASNKDAPMKNVADISIPKNVQLKLFLKVNQTVRIKIRTDGVLLFDHTLQKGTGEIFTADKSINIYTADGAATELVLNGKPIGPLGKGVLDNIEITRTGVKLK